MLLTSASEVLLLASPGRLVDGHHQHNDQRIDQQPDRHHAKGGMHGDLRPVGCKHCRVGGAFSLRNTRITPTTRFVNRLPGELRSRRESKNAQETTYAATRLGIEPTNNIQAPDQVLLRNKMAKSSAAIQGPRSSLNDPDPPGPTHEPWHHRSPMTQTRSRARFSIENARCCLIIRGRSSCNPRCELFRNGAVAASEQAPLSATER
ncbi:hypothetical protein ABH973_003814 [Bradyrhizobium ottawaense]